MTYWREGPPEVDGIIDGSWGKWAIEVKTEAVSLAEFVRRYPQHRPLVLCDGQGISSVERDGFRPMLWADFRLKGLSGADEYRKPRG